MSTLISTCCIKFRSKKVFKSTTFPPFQNRSSLNPSRPVWIRKMILLKTSIFKTRKFRRSITAKKISTFKTRCLTFRPYFSRKINSPELDCFSRKMTSNSLIYRKYTNKIYLKSKKLKRNSLRKNKKEKENEFCPP